MECREVIERLWEYLDDELAAEEAADLRRHLAGCRTCGPRCACDRAFLVLLVRSLTGPCRAPGELRTRLAALLRAG